MNDAVFVALADPTRRQLLERLATGPSSATGLAVRFPLTRQAVVKHLGALADAGMVAKQRHGREVRYRLESAPLGEASAWLTTLAARWESSPDARSGRSGKQAR
jgi:DNA-binding transcriptional ArsR family regulator